MDSSRFVAVLSATYNEPMKKNGEFNLKLRYIKKWVETTFQEKDLPKILTKIIKEYKPTSVCNCPLIPHIREIVFETSSVRDKATELANRIINCLKKYGFDGKYKGDMHDLRTRRKHWDMIKQEMGVDSWEILTDFGGWSSTFNAIERDGTSIIKAQLRDLAICYKKQEIKKNENKKQIGGVKNEQITNYPNGA